MTDTAAIGRSTCDQCDRSCHRRVSGTFAMIRGIATDPRRPEWTGTLSDPASSPGLPWTQQEHDMDASHTLDAMIFAQAAAHPAKTAVIDGTTHIDYAQLVARASAVANALDAHGVPPGSLVGVCMQRD